MSIIDRSDKNLLILLWVYTPSSSDDTDITFRDGISCDLKGSETVLDLTDGIKLVHLSTLHSRFSCDITLGESLICRTKNALPWTSPELRKK